jgi:hypothetical protein
MSRGVTLPPRPGPPSRLPRPPAFTVALREFLATEIGSGLLLVGATVFALLWANSPWGEGSVASRWAGHAPADRGGQIRSPERAR